MLDAEREETATVPPPVPRSRWGSRNSDPPRAMLSRWIRRSPLARIDRVAMVLFLEWMRTALLVWAAWCGLSLAYIPTRRLTCTC
ncbi:hypothetical protein BD310DRAFT_929960 [Dichomitus squalens]|uniref:Uncharacterized protein n=2 Tax=Dichomitus squalens TaxID=114155 RepID=A0A4Q9PSB9_9APHY|nr:hypothetical protein BD310DRAFT_929960 [Dichomitus squalens]